MLSHALTHLNKKNKKTIKKAILVAEIETSKFGAYFVLKNVIRFYA
jgi:hypothetical protein